MQHDPFAPGTAAGAATVTITAQIAIALASVPMAMMTLPLVVNVPEYFGNALGLNLALVGTIFMAVRIFDIVVDPVGGDRFTDSLRSLSPGANSHERIGMSWGMEPLFIVSRAVSQGLMRPYPSDAADQYPIQTWAADVGIGSS